MHHKNETENIVLPKIKQYCKIRGLSIYKLAKNAGIPYSSLNNIFIRNTEPTIPTLQKICNGLGITLSEFFEESNDADTAGPPTCRTEWLTEDEQAIIEMYHRLTGDEKIILKAYLQGLLKLTSPMDR